MIQSLCYIYKSLVSDPAMGTDLMCLRLHSNQTITCYQCSHHCKAAFHEGKKEASHKWNSTDWCCISDSNKNNHVYHSYQLAISPVRTDTM